MQSPKTADYDNFGISGEGFCTRYPSPIPYLYFPSTISYSGLCLMVGIASKYIFTVDTACILFFHDQQSSIKIILFCNMSVIASVITTFSKGPPLQCDKTVVFPLLQSLFHILLMRQAVIGFVLHSPDGAIVSPSVLECLVLPSQ